MNEDINEDINELLKEKASQLKEYGFDLIPKPNEEIIGYIRIGVEKITMREWMYLVAEYQ